MTTIGIDTDAIIQGGRTWMARNIAGVARHQTFGLGKNNVGYDRLFKSFLITEALSRENSYTQEQIQCLESELLEEIQSQENLQAVVSVPPSTVIGGGVLTVETPGGIDISGGGRGGRGGG